MLRKRREKEQQRQRQKELLLAAPSRLVLTPVYKNHTTLPSTGTEFDLPVSLGRRELAKCWWNSCPNRCNVIHQHKGVVPSKSSACQEYCKPIRKKSRLELLSRCMMQIMADNSSSHPTKRKNTSNLQVRVTAKNPNLLRFHKSKNHSNHNATKITIIIGDDWMRFQFQIWWQAQTDKGRCTFKKHYFLPLASDAEHEDSYNDHVMDDDKKDNDHDDGAWSSSPSPSPIQQQLLEIVQTTKNTKVVTRSLPHSYCNASFVKSQWPNMSLSSSSATRKALFSSEEELHNTRTNVSQSILPTHQANNYNDYDGDCYTCLTLTNKISTHPTNGGTDGGAEKKATLLPLSSLPLHHRHRQQLPHPPQDKQADVSNISDNRSVITVTHRLARTMNDLANEHSLGKSSKAASTGDCGHNGRNGIVPDQETPFLKRHSTINRKRSWVETCETRNNPKETIPPTLAKRRLQYTFTQQDGKNSEDKQNDMVQTLVVCTKTVLASSSSQFGQLASQPSTQQGRTYHHRKIRVSSSALGNEQDISSASTYNLAHQHPDCQQAILLNNREYYVLDETSDRLESQEPQGEESTSCRIDQKQSDCTARRALIEVVDEDDWSFGVNGCETKISSEQDSSLLQSTIETTVHVLPTLDSRSRMGTSCSQRSEKHANNNLIANGIPFQRFSNVMDDEESKCRITAGGDSPSSPMLIMPGTKHERGDASATWDQSSGLEEETTLDHSLCWGARTVASTTPAFGGRTDYGSPIRFCYLLSMEDWKEVHNEALVSAKATSCGDVNFRRELSALVLEMNHDRMYYSYDRHCQPSSLILPSLIDTNTVLGPYKVGS